MQYSDYQHQARYEHMVRVAKLASEDVERSSLIYILSSIDKIYQNSGLIYDICQNKAKLLMQNDIDEVFADGVFSGAELALIRLSLNLCYGYFDHNTNPAAIFGSIDSRFGFIALNAILIRFKLNLEIEAKLDSYPF